MTASVPLRCWVMPIDHTSTAARRRGVASWRSAPSPRGSCPTPPRARPTSLGLDLGARGPRTRPCARRTKGVVDRVRREQRLQHAVDERDVAARVDAEELVGHLRPEHRALGVARHPVPLEPRLAHRVDDHDLRPALARVEQVLHEDRLTVGDVAAEEDDEVALDDVGVGARGRGDADRALERGRRRRVAHPRRIVDVVGADRTRGLLRRVVDLVRDAARGEVERKGIRGRRRPDPRRSGRAPRPTRTRVKPALAGAADHRIRQPAELARARRRRARGAAQRRRAPSDRAPPWCSSAGGSSRVVQRWTPDSVQSWNPATPRAQPSHTPLRRIRHAYGRCRRLAHTTLAMSR